MLSVNGLTKRYGSITAVNNLSFDVPDGQVLGILGRNGAGKTTLLNMLTGCLAPTTGSITINGNDLLLDHRQAKGMIGYMPENAPLYNEMTVCSFLEFICELRDVISEKTNPHISDILALTGLEDIKNRIIGNLSKGLRQRVALAQALCGSPEILILDEPTAGLDPKQTVDFRRMIQSLAGKHTILFSSHILSEVQQVANRVIILDRGILAEDRILHTDTQPYCSLKARIAMDHNKLLPLVSALPGISEVKLLSYNANLTTDIMITALPDTNPEETLFHMLAKQDAPLLRLTSTQESLESIFLHATGYDIQ